MDCPHHTLKRKRGQEGEGNDVLSSRDGRINGNDTKLDRCPFTIQPCLVFDEIHSAHSSPVTLAPVCLLARLHLPLAYLDLSAPIISSASTSGTTNSSPRLFTASIPALEALNNVDDGVARLLIAEAEHERRLYAIERVRRHKYALCRLGAWVRRADLERKAEALLSEKLSRVRTRLASPGVGDGNESKTRPWWQGAGVACELLGNKIKSEGKKAPRLAMMTDVVSVREQERSLVAETILDEDHVTWAKDGVAIPLNEKVSPPRAETDATLLSADIPAVDEPPIASLTLQEHLQELAKHYLDALYLSRTSLAYFTKGPLSRARAAFSKRSYDTSTDLVTFLRDSLLTSTVMDAKYKDGMRGIIQDLPPRPLGSPEHAVKRKKQRKWKAKRNKSGFYIDESDYVERWWYTDGCDGGALSSAETIETAVRRRIPGLRSRETFLQIILVLEILALEASHPADHTATSVAAKESQDAQSQTLDSQAVDSQAPRQPHPQKRKPKKPQDLPALLDTLIERLCIWHSLEATSPAKTTQSTLPTDGEPNDELISFCTEVLLPFYMSRIPDHAAAANKKLGGPSAPTPLKRTRKPTTSSHRPGQPAVRHPPPLSPEQTKHPQSRKPLARVASPNDLHHNNPARRPARPATLQRSATGPAALLSHTVIKREAPNDIPAPSVPSRLQLTPAFQPPSRKQRPPSFPFKTTRQVDLSALSRASTAKLRQKADIEARLSEAIGALKKPNRALAVSEGAGRVDDEFTRAVVGGLRKGGRGGLRAGERRGKGPTVMGGVRQEDFGNGNGKGDVEVDLNVRATPKRLQPIAAAAAAATPLQPLLQRPVPPSAAVGMGQTLAPPGSSLAIPATDIRLPLLPPSAFAPAEHLAPQTGHRARRTMNVEDTPSRAFTRFAATAVAPGPGGIGVPESPVTVARRRVAMKEEVKMAQRNSGIKEGRDDVYDALGWREEYEELA